MTFPVSDPLEDPKLVIQYALEDAASLDKQFESFFNRRPFRQDVQFDSATGFDAYKFKFTERLSKKTRHDTARVAAELRSALDQCGYAVATASGVRKPKYAAFPFADSREKIEQQVAGRSKELPDSIRALYRSFNPYRGGCDILWSINEVANCTKHQFIVPVAHAIGAVAIKNFYSAGPVKELSIPPRWDEAKNEMTLCEVQHGAETRYDLNLGFVAVFGDIGSLKGRHVIPTLREMAAKVAEIVSATEAEARKLGLF